MRWMLVLILLIGYLNNQITFGKEDPKNPFLIQPLNNNISKRYIKMFDRDIEKILKSFDSQTGLIKVTPPENAVTTDHEIEKLSIKEKKEIAENPEYIWSYGQSRSSAQLASSLAYAYSIKQSRYFKSSEILEFIKQILRAFSEHQIESGEFVFSPIHYSTVFGTHEMAWRLEPLICAFENIKLDLSLAEKKSFRTMLNRAMEFLYTHPNSSLSNRGVVWCGVMAMCYRFSGEEKYLTAANQKFEWVGRLFNFNGEVREGPGPDLIYSTVSLQYLFLYRIMSGNKSLDPILLKSLRWYTRLFTSSAVPLEGMTTRMWISNGTLVSGVLGALCFYADEDSSFGNIATYYIEALEKMPGGFTLSHSSAHFLRGTEYHLSNEKLSDIPFPHYSELYKSDHSLYFLYGKNYQTAVTLRGRKPMKGLQTWSYNGEPPLILPTRKKQSSATGIGFDSHIMDAPWDISPRSYLVSKINDEINVVVSASGALRTAYVFANNVTLVLFHSAENGISTDWVGRISEAAEYDYVSNQQMFFKDSEAKIIFSDAPPTILSEDNVIIYQFRTENKSCWFAFTGTETSVEVKALDKNLSVILLKQFGNITKVLLNMSDESITQEENLLNVIDKKSLRPHEAVLIN